MWIPFYVPMPAKYLLYRGLEHEKGFIEEVVAARRVAAGCDFSVHPALCRGKSVCAALHSGEERWQKIH